MEFAYMAYVIYNVDLLVESHVTIVSFLMSGSNYSIRRWSK